jgi:hypothetical protein
MNTKRIFCEVYIEGVQVEFNSIHIQEVKGRPPVATVSFPADSKAMQLLPKTICHIFWRDDTENPVVLRSIFQGELSGNSMAFGFSSRQIAVSFTGFTGNWYSNYVFPSDVAIPNMVSHGLMCINTPDPNKSDNAQWQTKEFFGTLDTPLTLLANDLYANHKSLRDALASILNTFNTQSLYLGTVSKAFGIADQTFIYNSDSISKLVQTQTTSQFIANQIQNVDGNTTVAETMHSLLATFGYEYVELAAPSVVDGKTRRILIKPKTDFFWPIMCNTVFDDDIANMDFQRNLDQEPTRTVNLTVPSYIAETENKLASVLIATVVPQDIVVQSAFKEKNSLKFLGLTQEEQCRGILLSSHDDTTGIENAYYLSAAKSVLGESVTVSGLDDATTLLAADATKRSQWSERLHNDMAGPERASADAAKFHAYQINMASLAYLDDRHAQRTAIVATPYNPYRMIGFPGLILTKYFATLIGTIDSIDSQISADGTASQTVSFTHVRTYSIVPSTQANLDGADTKLSQYKPSHEYAFMDDNFSDPPPWYHDFTVSGTTTYYEAAGRNEMSLDVSVNKQTTGGTPGLRFSECVQELKRQYTSSQLSGTADAFILEKTKRPILTYDIFQKSWPAELRTLMDVQIWPGMPNIDKAFRALPWISDRRKRVCEVFDIVNPNILETKGAVAATTIKKSVPTSASVDATAMRVNNQWGSLLEAKAKKYNVPVEDVKAVMCMESGGLESERFNPEGKGKGANGLMQVREGAMTDYNRRFGTNYDVTELQTNNDLAVDVGTWYYAERYKRWDGNSTKAFAAYKGGDNGSSKTDSVAYAAQANVYKSAVIETAQYAAKVKLIPAYGPTRPASMP